MCLSSKLRNDGRLRAMDELPCTVSGQPCISRNGSPRTNRISEQKEKSTWILHCNLSFRIGGNFCSLLANPKQIVLKSNPACVFALTSSGTYFYYPCLWEYR